MGLDMYLNAERYYSKYNEPEKAVALRDQLGIPDSMNLGYVSVSAEIGYWRKANAIHAWFVALGGGEDDCRPIDVSRENLERLKGHCETVLAHRNAETADALLPPKEGFFFGSTAIDDGYFDDLQRTIEIIDRALSMPEGTEFSYKASW